MGKVEVMERLFSLGGKPLKLYDYQKEWVNDESQFRIVNKSRQIGFSFICAAEALLKAMFVPRSMILLVSTGKRGAQRLMKYIIDLWYSIPSFLRKKYPLASFSKEEISFKHNNSQIISLPNNPDGVRGFPATDIYIDEFAFFEKEEEMWLAILPSISRKDLKRRVSIISTPNGQLGHFYKIFTDKSNENMWSKHKVPWYKCPDLDISKLKKNMTDFGFKQEYLCEFIDKSVSVLTLEQIEECMPDNPPLKTYNIMPAGRSTYVGIDFGKKRDSTVVVFFERTYENEDPEPIYVMRRMDIYMGDYNKQVTMILDSLRKMNATQVWVDQTGVGEGVYDMLRKEAGSRQHFEIHGVIFTNKWKEKAVVDLLLLMQNKRLKLLKDDNIITQLHTLKRKVTNYGNVKYEHNKKTDHDDIFWAIALAVSKTSHVGGFFGMARTKIF